MNKPSPHSIAFSFLIVLFSALGLLMASPSRSAAAILYDFHSGADGYISDNPTGDTNTNFGGSVNLWARYSSGIAGYNFARESRDILIYFDLSSLAGNSVESATLTLTISSLAADTGGSVVASLLAYQMTTPWDVSSATWNNASSGTPWQAAAAQGSADRNPVPVTESASFTLNNGTGTVAVGDQLTLTLPVSLVQSWIDSPSSNHGLLISVATTNQYRYPAMSFYSNESGDVSLRPDLAVAVPEPGTVSLVSLFGVGVILAGFATRNSLLS